MAFILGCFLLLWKQRQFFFLDCVRLVGFNWNELSSTRMGCVCFTRALSSSTGGWVCVDATNPKPFAKAKDSWRLRNLIRWEGGKPVEKYFCIMKWVVLRCFDSGNKVMNPPNSLVGFNWMEFILNMCGPCFDYNPVIHDGWVCTNKHHKPRVVKAFPRPRIHGNHLKWTWKHQEQWTRGSRCFHVHFRCSQMKIRDLGLHCL